MVEKSGVEKFMVEKSGVEKFLFALGLKSSWLKSPGLKGLGLKLGVVKSGVVMSFNPFMYFFAHDCTKNDSVPLSFSAHFKAFSMIKLQYEIRICQKMLATLR